MPTEPRKKTVTRTRLRLVTPARVEHVPTGEKREVTIIGQDGRRRTEIEDIKEKVFREAVRREETTQEDIWVVETIPLSPRRLAKLPREQWPAPEVHEFTSEAAAMDYYAARQRTNPGEA